MLNIILSEKDIIRFWSNVSISTDTNNCWEWKISKRRFGYGRFKLNKHTCVSSRVSFTICNGNIPEGMLVCHKCDNPSCCNPTHLFLGTVKDNTQDMLSKKRNNSKVPHINSIGQLNHQSKLTEEQVLEIRRLYILPNHLSQRQLGKIYNVSKNAIKLIIDRKKWKHLL